MHIMLKFITLFIISFSPAIGYAIWIRNTEKYEREPWAAIFVAFAWGATLAIIAALSFAINSISGSSSHETFMMQ